MVKKNDEWLESDSGVKFLCWGKLKDSMDNPDDAVVVKKGEMLQGIITSIEEVMDKDESGDEYVRDYKWMLKSKDYDVPIMVWSNASMKRQIDDIGVSEGDEVQLIYQKDYKVKGGNTGRDIKLRVRKK